MITTSSVGNMDDSKLEGPWFESCSKVYGKKKSDCAVGQPLKDLIAAVELDTRN